MRSFCLEPRVAKDIKVHSIQSIRESNFLRNDGFGVAGRILVGKILGRQIFDLWRQIQFMRKLAHIFS